LRAHCACVIVKPDKPHRVVALGYNGPPSGEPHCEEVGCLIVDEHCIRTKHAEENAIQFTETLGAYDELEGCIMYLVSTSDHISRPCSSRCTDLVLDAGIRDIRIRTPGGERRIWLNDGEHS
jgi:dCMP deaminase